MDLQTVKNIKALQESVIEAHHITQEDKIEILKSGEKLKFAQKKIIERENLLSKKEKLFEVIMIFLLFLFWLDNLF